MPAPYQPRPARIYDDDDDADTLSFPKPVVVDEDNGMVVEDNNEESAHERMACLVVCLFGCVVVADAYR